jgi:hypothetical protein
MPVVCAATVAGGFVVGLAAALFSFPLGVAVAGEDEDRLLGGVISGLLGQPQDAVYLAREQERLVSLLQSGDYVTSRQGEPIDLVVLGVPLTHRDRVYTAKPVPPSQTSSRTSR